MALDRLPVGGLAALTQPSTPRLLTVGRLVTTKGLLTCLEAAKLLLHQGQSFRWTIIGEGPLHSELEARIAMFGLGEHVKLLGAKPHSEVMRHLSECDVFVLPSESTAAGAGDGIPVALMEAMALRRPVIATHAGGIAELVTPDNGLVIPQRDPDALANALQRLFQMTRHNLDLRLDRAEHEVTERFNAEREAGAMRDYFDRAAGAVS
ncbi:hypothetical protein Kisp01_27660 [Kineosporia sp. NBRC 101677]|uniref:glycosyltransferase n=1 Tax=Kineosporia sp. NBRC 101677 TaxID=3032197 RepID=UPI0024A4AA10|nr:glycosyltransferase [Kineosporia sp. NBRC 101677]GLY15751.1 hypothetical protein Kisp01_27660 [Kineosporia sp. NBRC 101677]